MDLAPAEREPFLSDSADSSLTSTAPHISDHANSHFSVNGVAPLDVFPSTRHAILAGLWSAMFLSSLNTTLVATLLPSISSEFKKFNEASWLGTSYLLAICTFTPLYGRLCDLLGRRGANRAAIITAALGTAACGFCGNMEMLILARFMSGVGGGGIRTTSSVVISDLFPLRSRGLAQGMTALFNGLGTGLGGPLGGLISDWFGWRWAFIMQLPLFALSLVLTEFNLCYVTPGKAKGTKEVLKRIDWGGSFTLLVAVGSFLVFLSMKYSEDYSWSDPRVVVPLVLACIFSLGFLLVELLVAREPVLAPFLLKERVPILVGMSNFLVAICNFSITYHFPTWFQTVTLNSASIAGLHLLPNSVAMSTGSLFAGWLIHRTGKYKTINDLFGFLPFIGIILITFIQEKAGPLQSWFSIIPFGFGNAIVFQTTLVALLAHLPEGSVAVGTGFGQLFRGFGQVCGVAVSSALFQYKLELELRARIQVSDADEMISHIRHSTTLVAQLPPDLQRAARDSYAAALHAVFLMAACSTLLAYIVRLPIPDKTLEGNNNRRKRGDEGRDEWVEVQTMRPISVGSGEADCDKEDEDEVHCGNQTR